MFTGLIEETGSIKQIIKIPGGYKFGIAGKKIFGDLKTDHSVSVCGVCLTVVKIENNVFFADAVGETLEKTTLVHARTGDEVNLERAMKVDDRFGGHLVQGHVGGIGTIKDVKKRGENWLLSVSVPADLEKYTIDEGSIAIDGISLTIAKKTRELIQISVIPHSYQNTIIRNYKTGTSVNIETDFFAKYVENFISAFQNGKKSNITRDWLKQVGY